MSRTSPRSAPRTTPASGWPPAATRSWAAERARKRQDLLQATEEDLGKIAAQVAAGRLTDPGKIGLKAGVVLNKRKMAKHIRLDIAEERITWQRHQVSIDAEALTDSDLRHPHPRPRREARRPRGRGPANKRLSALERDFRSIKADDLDLRPIFHRLDGRVRAHVLICTLACYLTWHLRRTWAPLTYTDEHPPQRENPVAPAPHAHDQPTPKPPARPDPAKSAHPRLPRPARPPSHPHPQRPALRPRPPSRPSPNPPPPSGAPSTSSAHPSRSHSP